VSLNMKTPPCCLFSASFASALLVQALVLSRVLHQPGVSFLPKNAQRTYKAVPKNSKNSIFGVPIFCSTESERSLLVTTTRGTCVFGGKMPPRHAERLKALAGTVGRNVILPFMLALRLASFFRCVLLGNLARTEPETRQVFLFKRGRESQTSPSECLRSRTGRLAYRCTELTPSSKTTHFGTHWKQTTEARRRWLTFTTKH
jgi:hypothetical protein